MPLGFLNIGERLGRFTPVLTVVATAVSSTLRSVGAVQAADAVLERATLAQLGADAARRNVDTGEKIRAMSAHLASLKQIEERRATA